MAYGNTSVSSLLRAAKAAQQKQYSLEDSIAAYEYDLSPKTQADFEKYQAHLGNRIKQYQGTDPLKALNYQKTITSANRSFTSSELSRATTQVLYGNMDNGTKLNTMMNLYQRAIENGDENLAQRIEGQAAMLQQTMQRYGGGGGYGRGGGAEYDAELKGIKDASSNFKRHEKLLQEEYRRGNISLNQMQGGFTDPRTGEHIPGLRQTYESINSLKSQLEGGAMTPEREAAYVGLLDTLKSPQAQMMTNKAGQMTQAGENIFAKKYNPTTRSFEVEKQNIQGYDMTDLGAMFKAKVDSDGNIVYKSGPKDMQDTTLFPKFAANDLGGYQYAFAPPELGGKAEWIVRQNRETGEYEFLGTKDQLKVDPRLQADVGVEGQVNNPLVQAANALGLKNNLKAAFTDVNMEAMKNPALAKAIQDQDVLGSTLEYGKTKASKLLDKKKVGDLVSAGKNFARGAGLDPNAFLRGVTGVTSGILGLTGLGGLQKQVDEYRAKSESHARAQAEAARARAAAEADALKRSIEEARRQAAPAPRAPFRPAPAPTGNTIRQITNTFTGDPFSQAGIGTNSLYRL